MTAFPATHPPPERLRLVDRPEPALPTGRSADVTMLVPRERLVAQLAASSARIVLLHAPAGYGKTTLLEAWESADPRPFHWLQPENLAGSYVALDELAAGRRRTGQPRVLLLDGLADPSSPAVTQALARIAHDVPSGSTLAVASRARAPLPVGRLRTEQQVLELGPSELRLSPQEVAEAFRAHRLRLRADDTRALVERIEGWPAAVALAALSLAAERGPSDGAQAFRGDDRFVVEYLYDTVLADVPGTYVDRLIRWSVADTLEPELCDHLTGQADAGSTLAELERMGVPIFRLDRAGRRYRCHALLRDALYSELCRTDPAGAATLHRRAMRWHEDHGELDLAVDHAIAAGDATRAATLMWRLAPSYIWDQRADRLETWLARLPARRIEQHAVLAAVAAACHVPKASLAHAEHWIELAAGHLDGLASPVSGAVRAETIIVHGLSGSVGLAASDLELDAVSAKLERNDPWRSLCYLLSGVSAALAGDAPRAHELLEEGARVGIVPAAPAAALCEAQLALLALCAGDWERGALLAERARTRIARLDLDDTPLLVLVVATSAFARAHRGRIEQALQDLEATQRMLARSKLLAPWYVAEVDVALARGAVRLGEVAIGRSAIADASRLAARVPEARVLKQWVAQAAAAAASAKRDGDPLTAAELRVLRFLPSHFSFREIGAQLYVSANTVKTQAHAVYRKLDASSRSSAVEHARRLGLLDPDPALGAGALALLPRQP